MSSTCNICRLQLYLSHQGSQARPVPGKSYIEKRPEKQGLPVWFSDISFLARAVLLHSGVIRFLQLDFAECDEIERPSNTNREETMLILTRKTGTSIKIGQDVVIHVIHTGRSTVKIGIEAPSNVKIMRGELHDLPSRFDLDDIPEEALLLQH